MSIAPTANEVTHAIRRVRGLHEGTVFVVTTGTQSDTWKVLPGGDALFLSHSSQEVVPVTSLFQRYPHGRITVVTSPN